MHRILAVLAVLTAFGTFTGCDLAQHDRKKAAIQPAHPTVDDIGKDIPLYDPSKNLSITDLSLVKSGARSISGDLRPFWILSGRIENKTELPVKNLHLRVTLRYRGTATDVDSAEVAVNDEIPGGATSSFMRDLQILPPRQPWEWDCTATEATTLNVP
jgi:hypothetical protein